MSSVSHDHSEISLIC